MTLLFPTIFFSLSYNLNSFFIFLTIFLGLLNIATYQKNVKQYLFFSTLLYFVYYFVYYLYDINFSMDYFIELLSFLTPTNFNQILQSNCEKDCSYIFKDQNISSIILKSISYFLGKVAFWYGSFHTVAAFRKFNRAL